MIITDIVGVDFNKVIAEYTDPVIINFFAEWCGPCKMMHPVLEEINQEQGDKITIYRIDIDANEKVAEEMEVMVVPTFILAQNGQVVNRLTGFQPKPILMKAFK